MRSLLVATAVGMIGLAPGLGMACEYGDEAAASTAPPAQVASTPAATKAQPAAVAKTVAPSAVKPVATKTKASASDQKLAASSAN